MRDLMLTNLVLRLSHLPNLVPRAFPKRGKRPWERGLLSSLLPLSRLGVKHEFFTSSGFSRIFFPRTCVCMTFFSPHLTCINVFFFPTVAGCINIFWCKGYLVGFLFFGFPHFPLRTKIAQPYIQCFVFFFYYRKFIEDQRETYRSGGDSSQHVQCSHTLLRFAGTTGRGETGQRVCTSCMLRKLYDQIFDYGLERPFYKISKI